ncbi:MAG: DUF4290 domain-containing protein [Flavobacteriales bacterium]|jgi:hypothetical protein|nr:DUF4290 domain-containing protein [Flavobacteriales bacterium]
MEYNTARNQLILPEYGRHVQKMVEYATTLNDKKERTKCVNAIIDFMGQMNPHLRDIKEFTHKLWDHLYIMSEFKIDAESPYPIPEIEKLQEKPKKMPYPNNKIKFPFYGAALENMIRFTVAMDEGRQKEIMTGMVANHMKKSYLLFNKHSVNNDTIKLHLDQLSNNKLKIPADFEFIRSESVVTRNPKVYKKKFKKRR